jgi:peptide/nickel transport system substrate-binding protein
LAGGVDVLTDVEPKQALQMADDPRFRLYHSASTGMGLAVYWNHRSPALRDPEVRRALMLAVDRPQLQSVLGFPEDTPILDGPTSLRQLARGEFSEPVGYDSAEAGRLLDGAGWVDSDGDGIRDRAGQALMFTTLVSDQPTHLEIGVSVQAMLRRVGVQMELQPLEGRVLYQRVEAGNFEAAVRSTGIPANWLQRYFGSESRLGYRSPEVRVLVDRLESTADPDVRDEIFLELTDIFRVEAPALFLFPKVQFVVATRRVQGLSSPWRAVPTLYMDALRLGDRGQDD